MGIAKKVVDSHRGKIEVSSRVGEGTELSISIPLADAAREYLNGAAPSTQLKWLAERRAERRIAAGDCDG